mgnify:CR=1 FL=1
MAKKAGKAKRVATTNIKVTVPTHREIQVATDIMRGKTQSEVISLALRALLPNLPDELRRRDEVERSAAERASNLSN